MNDVEDFVIKLNVKVLGTARDVSYSDSADNDVSSWGWLNPKREPYPGEGNRHARRAAKAQRRGKVA